MVQCAHDASSARNDIRPSMPLGLLPIIRKCFARSSWTLPGCTFVILQPPVIQSHPSFHAKFRTVPYSTVGLFAPIYPSRVLQSPHLLQVLDDGHVGVHVSIDAVLHARLLVAIQSTLGETAGDTLLEAHRVELVDCWCGCQYVICNRHQDWQAYSTGSVAFATRP